MKTAIQIRAGLRNFNNVRQTKKHKSGFRYTAKVNFLAKAAECDWLIDLIGSYQPRYRRFLIQCWKVEIREDKVRLSFWDERGNQIFWCTVPANDFPLWEGIELRVCSNILYLPRRQQLQRPKLVLCGEMEMAA